MTNLAEKDMLFSAQSAGIMAGQLACTCGVEVEIMIHILVFGDSNAWGYDASTWQPDTGAVQRMPFDVRWPGRLQLQLGNGFRVVEDCLNGRTLMQEDPYFPNRRGLTALQSALDAHAPLDLVIFQLGCNELKQFFHLTPGMIAFGMEALVQEAMRPLYGYPSPKVLLICPHPTHPDIGEMCFGFSFGAQAYEKSVALGDWYGALAKKTGCAYLDCKDLHMEINTIDGLHYSSSDHAKLADAVMEQVLALFPEQRSGR